MSELDDIKPLKRLLVMELAKEAGIDVSDWTKFKRGKAKAATNPKYCYEWSFVQPGQTIVLNFWHSDMREVDKAVTRQLNLRKSLLRETDHSRKRRALRMDDAIRLSCSSQVPIRVIVLDGTRPNSTNRKGKVTRVKKRLLDPVSWAVTAYDFNTGQCTLTRGAVPKDLGQANDDEETRGFEGSERWLFVLHRRREARLRNQKLQQALRSNQGRLICEVPKCGFDFAERYGALGVGYAHVHHTIPLSQAPKEGRIIPLSELVIVCANCHAMIHKGGDCRPLESLIERANEYNDRSPTPGQYIEIVGKTE
jgi:hypothetical protein